jgi:hypothetical protein
MTKGVIQRGGQINSLSASAAFSFFEFQTWSYSGAKRQAQNDTSGNSERGGVRMAS